MKHLDEQINLIGRLENWKFGQARKYDSCLKFDYSKEILIFLEKFWGDTGWSRGDTFVEEIIRGLVNLIFLMEKFRKPENIHEEIEFVEDII